MTFQAAAGPHVPGVSPAVTGNPAEGDRPGLIAQAHQRSESYGLRPYESPDFCPVLQNELKTQIERSQSLFTYALPVMETLYDQIVNTQSMVILTDAAGLILHSLGDDDFLAKASKVALQPGALWSEESRGTNAIGTALAENKATLVHGAEHFLEANRFLTCSCMPILDAYGKTVGALDVTGDQRGFHKHTMALVRMSAQMIENQLFANAFQDMVCVRFHSRAEFIGTLVEGIASFTPGGRFLSANRSAQFQLGMSVGALHAHTFSSLFGLSLSQLFDAERKVQGGVVHLPLPSGVKVSARIEWKAPAASVPAVAIDRGSAQAQCRPEATSLPHRAATQPTQPGLDDLDTGDAQIQGVITKLRKVIGKDIPIMVLGETGTGKELLARAIHADSPRHAGPFIAVNCASIPETLIESELFGYEEGAFTGARKKGGIGKMLLANGGTLFLDEIGDMPLHLQARMLRALQERAVTPLGSSKVIHVDVSVICATNRNMREQVANGLFREDLYYRLNGLVVRLPALRERSDLDVVANKLLREGQASGGPRIKDAVMAMFRSYHWPGNIRQLGNLLRTARLMAEGEPEITEDHLPDDFLEDRLARQATHPTHCATVAADAAPDGERAAGAAPRAQPTRLADVEALAIVAAVKAHHGNISAAAKALGISRNTVYRKLDEANALPQQDG